MTQPRAVCLHDYMFSSEKEEAVIFLEDFLEVIIEKAHQRNMQVHPIIHPGYRVKLEGEIKDHPEWLIRGKREKFILT